MSMPGESASAPAQFLAALFSSSATWQTLFFTVVAWLMMPAGPGDSNHIEGAWFAGFAGAVLALVTALLTLVAVKARWLGRRWLIVPTTLFVVATARWAYIDVVYPEPPDRYRFGSVRWQ